MHAVKDQGCVQHSGNGIGKCPLTCAIFNIFLSIIAALLHLNVHLAPRRAKIVEGDAKATGWSDRFSGQTGCNFDGSGLGSCVIGDCGPRTIECNDVGAAPLATPTEFTLNTGGQDFYNVSLIDGCNMSMRVEGSGWSGMYASMGCTVDLNQGYPTELKVGDDSVCRSACEAFGSPEYSCSSAYSTPAT
ncbi:hypothetical protein VitviT2T_005836 [Vitis vinifera]|uniref:Thaumatin-like protein 1 n=2 Tax=Vitis vinifera TaxID=29760 RepID=A0ABY9BU57_VITVI|nr:hypothetical protein VitviT2T_005836 [Vitis vinifera]